MKIINLKCKVITPMFMSGTDRNTAELRASEFKGMMRFWWRAIKSEKNIDALRRDEAIIFGGTGENEGKSKVRIRIYPQPNNWKGNNLKADYKLNWYFDKEKKSLAGNHYGIGYLLYSTVLPNNERAYIKHNSSFNIELSSMDNKSFKHAIASLWTSIYLGGFGTRSRRGGGNIVVEKVEGESLDIDFIPKGKNSSEIFNWINENLKKCFELTKSEPSNFISDYSTLSFSRIMISKNSFNSWIDALNDIGQNYANFRKNHKRDVFGVACFGLPVMHRNKTKVEGENVERRSSPLILKVIFSEGKYYWMILRLNGKFLKDGEKLALKEKNEKWKIIETQKPDFRLIDKFWNELKQYGIEYTLFKTN